MLQLSFVMFKKKKKNRFGKCFEGAIGSSKNVTVHLPFLVKQMSKICDEPEFYEISQPHYTKYEINGEFMC